MPKHRSCEETMHTTIEVAPDGEVKEGDNAHHDRGGPERMGGKKLATYQCEYLPVYQTARIKCTTTQTIYIYIRTRMGLEIQTKPNRKFTPQKY